MRLSLKTLKDSTRRHLQKLRENLGTAEGTKDYEMEAAIATFHVNEAKLSDLCDTASIVKKGMKRLLGERTVLSRRLLDLEEQVVEGGGAHDLLEATERLERNFNLVVEETLDNNIFGPVTLMLKEHFIPLKAALVDRDRLVVDFDSRNYQLSKGGGGGGGRDDSKREKLESKLALAEANLRRTNFEILERLKDIESRAVTCIRTGMVTIVTLQMFISKQSLHGVCGFMYSSKASDIAATISRSIEDRFNLLTSTGEEDEQGNGHTLRKKTSLSDILSPPSDDPPQPPTSEPHFNDERFGFSARSGSERSMNLQASLKGNAFQKSRRNSNSSEISQSSEATEQSVAAPRYRQQTRYSIASSQTSLGEISEQGDTEEMDERRHFLREEEEEIDGTASNSEAVSTSEDKSNLETVSPCNLELAVKASIRSPGVPLARDSYTPSPDQTSIYQRKLPPPVPTNHRRQCSSDSTESVLSFKRVPPPVPHSRKNSQDSGDVRNSSTTGRKQPPPVPTIRRGSTGSDSGDSIGSRRTSPPVVPHSRGPSYSSESGEESTPAKLMLTPQRAPPPVPIIKKKSLESVEIIDEKEESGREGVSSESDEMVKPHVHFDDWVVEHEIEQQPFEFNGERKGILGKIESVIKGTLNNKF